MLQIRHPKSFNIEPHKLINTVAKESIFREYLYHTG